MATRHRPRRGAGGPLVEGDTGNYGGPQGGDEPGATESGDLLAREYGVPQADLPGGIKHLVNPETVHAKPHVPHERPADLHKFHGVPPIDNGQYVTPPTEDQDKRPDKPKPVPKLTDAVPVYIVQEATEGRVRRDTACFNINVPAAGSEPIRVCNRDPDRIEIRILNEDSTSDIRICEERTDLLTTSAQGTGPAGAGALIWHGTNSYTEVKTQGELFAISTSTSSARLSVIIVTEVND